MTLPIQDPTLAAEGLGVPPRRHGFLRSVLRERKTAVIGLAIIVFFILLAVIAPYISPYSATAQTCAVYEPPSASHWLGCDDGGIDMLSELMQGGRISLVVGFAATFVAIVIGGGVGILSGLFRPLDRHRPDAGDRLPAGHPRPGVRRGDRGPLGAEPVPRDHRDRHPGVDLHRADHPRPGHEPEGTGVRQARPGDRVRPRADHHPAHPAAGRPAADGQHRAHHRDRDLPGDRAGLPRPGRPHRHHLGHHPGARLRADGDQLRRVVGDRAGRVRDRDRHRRLLPARAGHRGRAEPAAEGGPPVGPPLADPAAGRTGARAI